MIFLNRPGPSSLCLTFKRVSSVGRACLSRYLQKKFPARCSQLFCRNFSTVNADSWGTGKKYIRGYEDIEELESAPEEVKKIFSLQNANQVELRKVALEKVKEDYSDRTEEKIAAMTVKIEAVKKNNERLRGNKDIHNKVFLNWLIQQRRKRLAYLRNARFERYLAVLKALDLPPLDSPLTKWNKYKFRKFKIGVEVKEKKGFQRRR